MSIEIPDDLYCVVFPADVGRDKIGSTNVFEGRGADANGIEEDRDFPPIAELDAKLRERAYVPEEERKLLEPKFSALFEDDSTAVWEKYFTSDSTHRTVTPFESIAYQNALLLSAGKLIGVKAYDVCLISYVHRWFLAPISQITFGLQESGCYVNKEQELPVIMRLCKKGHFDAPFNFWPRSDVRLDVMGFPIILTEIDSGTKLDENRLMLQASYLAKVACLAQKEITVMAIYFSRSGAARIYLVASDSSYKVKYLKREILVNHIKGVLEVMRTVFNFASYASDFEKRLTSIRFEEVTSEITFQSKTFSSRTAMYSKKRQGDSDDPSGSAKKPRVAEDKQEGTQSGQKHGNCSSSLAYHSSPYTMRHDPEPSHLGKRRRVCVEGAEMVAISSSMDTLVDPAEPIQLDDGEEAEITEVPDQEGVQIFLDDEEKAEVAEVLDQEGVEIFLENDVEVVPPPLFCGRLRDGQLVVIKVTKREEVSIHSMLSRVMNPSSHIIPLLGHCHAFGELHLLITPLRTPLRRFGHLKPSFLHSNAVLLMTQLLQATAFIHRNYVAHLDIRPDNLVLNGEGSIQMIDFGVAVQVASANDRIRGFRGCAPWVAPEVKADEYFEPFAVDLYACGRVIRHYSAFFPAGDGEWLVEASVGLMGEAASRTSVMSKVMKSLNTKVPQSYGIV